MLQTVIRQMPMVMVLVSRSDIVMFTRKLFNSPYFKVTCAVMTKTVMVLKTTMITVLSLLTATKQI